MNHMEPDRGFRIGSCLVQPNSLSIQVDGAEKQTLQPKFIEVIAYLAAHYPRVVPRQELIDAIWSGNEHVGDKALTNAVWHLRQSLKTSEDDDEIIETIRKIGYRLLPAPQWLQESDTEKQPGASSSPPSPSPVTSARASIVKTVAQVVAYSLLLPGAILLGWYYLTTQGQKNGPVSQQITREPGSERHAAPSPDGRYIVYRWQSFGQSVNLFMRDLQQPQMPARQLTFDQARQRFSVWSNDGQYLYFHRRNTLESVCDIVQLKVATKQERRVAGCSLQSGITYMDISPDDDVLAYQAYSQETGSGGIYFVDLADPTAEPARFSCAVDCGYRDRDMAFAPDGLKIAVTRRTSSFNENIFLVDLATKEAEQLTVGEKNITGLTWHPDGKRIVYSAEYADVRYGYVVDIDSKKIQKLGVADFAYPAYARQTGELFYEQRAFKSKILSLQLDNDISRTPFPVVESRFSHHSPHYSARAQSIVYVSNESGHDELWMADSDGKNRRQLTYLKRSVQTPRWSHAGDRVVFIGPDDDDLGETIYVIDIESGKLAEVPVAFNEYGRPSWSYDDNAIVVAVYGNVPDELYQITISDGTLKQLTFDGGRFGVMTSLSTLLYTRTGRGLWQRDIHAGNPAGERVDGRLFSHPYAWVYHNGGVYFRRNRSDHHEIIYYDFKQDSFTTLVRLPIRTFRSRGQLSFIPQEGKLLYSGTQFPQVDIKKLTHPLLQ